jgi:tetratricopeptide (TPR) repeat protein
MWFLFLALLAQSANLVDQGGQALDAKQYDRAIQLFTEAATADPKDYTAQFQLALTYSLLGRDAEAIPHYRTTLDLKPGLYEAELNLGLSLVRTNDPAGAIPYFRAAAAQKPQEFTPTLHLAQSLYSTRQYPEAEAAFRNAIALNNRSAAAESGLAMSLARQNRADDAAPHFQQAFVLDRSYRAGFVELAQLYEAAGRTSEAITFYKMFPDNPVALERLGVLLTAAGQYPEAIQALEAVMEKMPTGARRMDLAQAYVKNKQGAKAVALLAPAVAEMPNDFELRMLYGRLLRDQRRFPDAVEQFEAATRINAKAAEAWSELAGVLTIAEQYPQALIAFDRLRALGAETPSHYFFRALAHDHLHQLPEAVEYYKKFLASSQGKFPDQEFQARQRVRILETELRKR